ncbi:hypothetical protein IC802_00225 [Geobacillus sp. 44C]|nr:hypothetical protein IC802_00225 [Geobacillus sp. 44C]
MAQGSVYWYMKWKRLKEGKSSITPNHVLYKFIGKAFLFMGYRNIEEVIPRYKYQNIMKLIPFKIV